MPRRVSIVPFVRLVLGSASWLIVVLVVALLAQLAAPRSASAQTADAEARARALYRQGSAAFKARDYPTAHRVWQEAWDLKKTYDVAGALAQVELELGLHREAAEHLDYCLQNFPARESEDRLTQLRRRLQEVRQHVATLRIRVDPEGSDVIVDGRLVGKSPISQAVYMNPGRHTIEARYDGQSVERAVDAVAGREQHVQMQVVELGPTASGVSASAAAASADGIAPYDSAPVAAPPAGATNGARDAGVAPGSRGERSMLPVYVGAGVAAIAVGVGVGYRVVAEGEREDVERFSKRFGSSGCVSGAATVTECRKWKDTARDVERHRDISTVSLAVAGTALVATAAYFFLWPPASGPAPNATSRRSPGGAGSFRFSAELDSDRRLLWLFATY